MSRAKYVWDYDVNEEQFREMLAGGLALGRLDQRWAAVRLLDYGSWADIRELIGFRLLVEKWAEWRDGVRSRQRRESLDWLVEWLPENRPEWLNYTFPTPTTAP